MSRNSDEGGACSMQGKAQKVVRYFGQKNRKEKDQVEDLGVGRKRILKHILNKQDRRVWTGLIRPRIGKSGYLL